MQVGYLRNIIVDEWPHVPHSHVEIAALSGPFEAVVSRHKAGDFRDRTKIVRLQFVGGNPDVKLLLQMHYQVHEGHRVQNPCFKQIFGGGRDGEIQALGKKRGDLIVQDLIRHTLYELLPMETAPSPGRRQPCR